MAADRYITEKDEALFYEVQKMMDGNFESYQNMYELSKKYIYKVINDIVQNHHTTEDMMQETYLQIFNKIGTLRDARAFYVWAGRIASNLTLRYLQKYRKEVLLEENDEDGADFVFERVENDNEAFIPESVLENKEQQKIIADILAGLSPEQKLCVQYFYYEEMSVGDIANAMECSTGTIKSRLNYARKALKTAISKFETDNNVKLYSLASIPVFYLVFREMVAASVVTGSAAGAAVAGSAIAESAMADGAVGSASVAAGGAGTAGSVGTAGVTATAGTVAGTTAAGTTTAASTGFLATAVGKAVVTVATIAVSSTVAVTAADVSQDQMFREQGYVLTSDQVLEELSSLYPFEIPADPDEEWAEEPDIQEYTAIDEFMGADASVQNADEDYLAAVNVLAEQFLRYQEAMEYSLTDEQMAYIDVLMAGYMTEMENYLNQGSNYELIMTMDSTDTFRDQYYPELLEIIYEEADLIGQFADIYSKQEIKDILATHTAADIEEMLNMGGGIGDVVAPELSESTLNELYLATENYFALLTRLTEWSETVMADPAVSQFFAAPQ